MRLPDLFRESSILEKLRPFADDPDIFVTFTEILKVGINPVGKWSDPIGVYAYPVREEFEHFEQKMVPFGGNRPFAYILRAEGNRLELQDYTRERLVADLKTIEDTFMPMLLALPTDNGQAPIADPEAYWNAFRDRTCDVSSNHPGLTMWHFTGKVARYIAHRFPNRDHRMVWNSLFRACGYDSVVDRNGGFIATNEPSQAVFLSIKGFTVVEACNNDLLL